MKLAPLTARSILARTRPRAILLVWTWDALLGALMGSTVASIATTAYGHHPDGDAPLFAPGGLPLMDLVRHSLAARGPVIAELLILVVVARLGGLVPEALAFTELAFVRTDLRAPRTRDALSRASGALPAFLSVALFTSFAEAGVLLFGAVVAAMASTTTSLGPRGGNLSFAAVACLAVVAATTVGIVGDMARAAVVRWNAGAVVAAMRAVERFRQRPARLTWSYGWRAGASWLPVGIGAWLASGLGGRDGAPLLVLLVFHQGIVLIRAAIHVSWMARATRAV